jgi:hypothetical protein
MYTPIIRKKSEFLIISQTFAQLIEIILFTFYLFDENEFEFENFTIGSHEKWFLFILFVPLIVHLLDNHYVINHYIYIIFLTSFLIMRTIMIIKFEVEKYLIIGSIVMCFDYITIGVIIARKIRYHNDDDFIELY